MSLSIHTGGLEPGEYTVAFSVTDAAGNRTALDHPGGWPAPNGPMILTVVEG